MPKKGSGKSKKQPARSSQADEKTSLGKVVENNASKPNHQPQRRTKKIKKVVKKTRKVWSKPIIAVWVLVALLLIANIVALGLSAQTTSGPGDVLDENLEGFERLSYWQSLLFGDSLSFLGGNEHRSVFDGLPLDPEYQESVVSVMVDNFSLARPQHSGIRSASLVYEFLVEGGITRLMAIFPYQELDRVGPVRSSRDYSVSYAEENGGIHVHMGGSPAALKQLGSSKQVFQIEEDIREQGPTYSFRDDRYSAPHNLFFDLLAVREHAKEKDWGLKEARAEWCFNLPTETPLLIEDDEPSTAIEETESPQEIKKLEIDFSNDSSSSYYIQFQYFPDQEVYKRFYFSGVGVPHTDQHDSLQVSPSNIIVQIAPSSLIDGDEQERLQMSYVGSGTAFYYLNGLKYEGRWKKNTSNAATQFLDADGDPMCLNPGQTWIAIVDSEDLLSER